MAPIGKRASGSKAPPAKKAKTVAPEAPIIEFIAKCNEIPKSCREMLMVSVPICLEVGGSDRHHFQAEVLEQVAKLIAVRESAKRAVLTEAKDELAKINVDKDKAATESSETKAAADAKHAEWWEKGSVVDSLCEIFNAAQEVLKGAQKSESDFYKNKDALSLEQANFNKLMTEVFQPLKDNTHQGRQRNKLIGELCKKLSELGAQESLVDALGNTFKMTPEKREGTFAKATLEFAQEYFTKHNAKVAQDIASLDAEEAGHKAAVAREEATVAEKKAEFEPVSKEWDEMQDVWLGLDKTRAEAARAEKSLESQIPRAQKTIDKATADMEKFMEVPTLLAHLKEKSTTAADEPEPEEEQQDAEGANAKCEKPDEAMKDAEEALAKGENPDNAMKAMQAELRDAMHAS